ncbi:MAG: hypothetical protein K6A94_11075 [Bacteroidales bacterium]|nr:hypothetical protein [Bacteroidales bacterium]
MKKVLLTIAVVAMIGFASCTKSKNCRCTATIVGQSVTVEMNDQKVKSCSDIDTSKIPGYESLTNITFTCTEVK